MTDSEGFEGRYAIGCRALASALIVLAAAACGGAHGAASEPIAKFPTQAHLDEIAAQPAQPIEHENVFRVAEWSPTPPEAPAPAASDAPPAPDGSASPPAVASAAPPPAVGTAPPAPVVDHWTSLFGEVAAQHPEVTVVPALGCAAREVAKLFAQHGALPDRRAQEFIVGACGGSTVSTGVATEFADVPDTVADAELFTQWRDKLRSHIAQVCSQGRVDAGFAFVHKGGKAVAAMVVGKHTLDGVKSPIVADAQGRALIEGGVVGPVQYLQAYINQGALQSRECIRDQTVALPRFRVWCQVQPGDSGAWVDIQVAEPERILARSAGRILVRATPDAQLQYQAAPSGPTATSGADVRQKLLAAVNGMRASDGAAPLVSADKQAVSNERLAPHLFSASEKNNAQLEESIMLGLIAGWNVSGMIRNGDFYSYVLSGSTDVTDLVSALLDHPSARHVLMDHDARQIAVGPVLLPNRAGMGTVITTYSFFETNDHRADEAALFQRIIAARRLKGLPLPQPLDNSALHDAATKIQNGTSPDEAIRKAARPSARPGFSLLVQATDLRRMPVPPELLTRGPLNLAIGITHYRAPGGAWGQYVVMFLVRQ
jgi:hypothetical protein